MPNSVPDASPSDPQPAQPPPPTSLGLKRVGIDTYRENVAYLHRDCAVYRAEGFQALSKIAITNREHRILAVLNVVDDPNLVRKHRGCLVWGGTAKLAPVDDILIAVERPLGIDSQGQMVASILSKKLAAGSTHLLIDIPVGPTAKVRQMNQALALRKLFEYVGDRLGLHLEVVITDGRQPVGRGIGPVLEVRDVMQVLANDPHAPADLRRKSLHLAGRILEFDPYVRGGHGYAIEDEYVAGLPFAAES